MLDPRFEATRASLHQLTFARTEGFIRAYQLLAGELFQAASAVALSSDMRWAPRSFSNSRALSCMASSWLRSP